MNERQPSFKQVLKETIKSASTTSDGVSYSYVDRFDTSLQNKKPSLEFVTQQIIQQFRLLLSDKEGMRRFVEETSIDP